MKYTSFEIRTALVQLGQKRGFEYPLCVVREVIAAFKADAAHPVKDLVIAYLENIRSQVELKPVEVIEPVEYVDKAEVVELYARFNRRGLIKVIARAVNVSPQNLSMQLRGYTNMSRTRYKAISSQLDSMFEVVA